MPSATDKMMTVDSFGRTPQSGSPRDRFELLSAYLDGEATAAERQQVQHWLDSDPEVQQLYRRLLALRRGFQTIPTPVAAQSSDEIARGVFQRLRQRQLKRTAVLGGGAIAAVLVGTLSSLLSGGQAPGLKFAESNPSLYTAAISSSPIDGEMLKIAIDRPVVEIPKAAVSTELKKTEP